MAKKSIHVDHWFYSEPDMKPNKDGRRELVAKACFGPLEVYAWGIDLNGRPYKEYEWIENDFFADENYHIEISWDELISEIENMRDFFREREFYKWAETYETVRKELLQLAQK